MVKQRKNGGKPRNGVPWWRKLVLPRRGVKDSRLRPAVDTPEQVVKLEKRRSTLWAAISVPKASKVTNLAVAIWHAASARAALVITKGKGPASMGDHIQAVQYLQPEEAAFLVDRGALDLLVDGVPASQQRVMSLLLCPSRGAPMNTPPPMSHDVYAAYGHLRRVGYVVRRAEAGVVSAASAALAVPLSVGGGVGGLGGRGLGVSLTVWKAGAFRRRTPSPPYFHVAVLPYESAGGGGLPSHAALAALVAAVAPIKVRLALVERATVSLVDVGLHTSVPRRQPGVVGGWRPEGSSRNASGDVAEGTQVKSELDPDFGGLEFGDTRPGEDDTDAGRDVQVDSEEDSGE